MHKDSIGQRIQKVREHFNLSRKEFIQVVKVNLSTISRIEADKQKPSDIFLDALMAQFLVNPDWVRTGEGNMLISSQEYITKGITVLGVEKFGEGLATIIKNPKFEELSSLLAINDMVAENLDPQLATYLQYILNKWQQGDENIKGWLKIQLDSLSK